MNKTLRSLIHEKFPLELRVKIELLAKRRDLVNKEKQEELFNLLREFGIKDVVPLGSGTNRYCFKMDGFAIKIATDNDGRIDNLKEFKMSPLLQPYVTKAYEIEESGSILVAEYIAPFTSYPEMLAHQDGIRAILKKLSTMYLLGDVGITSVNTTNWGTRFGSDEPVCLDYAYIFDVSSSLFICPYCHTNSMLEPNRDFTALICSNPKCGKKVTFQEVRMKLSNEEHLKEIGSLDDMAYALTESNVDTELTPSKSPYLSAVQAVKENPINENVEPEVDNFIIEKEDNMSDLIVKAWVIDNPNVEEENVVEPEEAFTVPIIQNGEFKPEFLSHLAKAISNLSNKINDDLKNRDIMSTVKPYIAKKKNVFPKDFYKFVENAVFRSLVDFFGMTECQMPNDKTPGTHRDWILENDIPPETYGTLKFIERFWNIKAINKIDDAEELMDRYKAQFNDYQGISLEWTGWFTKRLKRKYPDLTPAGVSLISNEIARIWCTYEPKEEDDKGFMEEDIRVGDLSDEGFIIDMGTKNDVMADAAEDEDDEEDDMESYPIWVGVDDKDDRIMIFTSDEKFGNITIPIYANLNDDVDLNKDMEIMGSAKNGDDEWLVHFMPDMMFFTDRPEYWMNKYNTEDSKLKIVILDEFRDDHILMGSYVIDGIRYIGHGEDYFDSEPVTDPDILHRVCVCICNELAMSKVSYIGRSVERDEADIYTEQEFLEIEAEGWNMVKEDDEEDSLEPDDDKDLEIQPRTEYVPTEEHPVPPIESVEEVVKEEVTEEKQPEESNVDELTDAAIAALGIQADAPIEPEAPEEVQQPETEEPDNEQADDLSVQDSQGNVVFHAIRRQK